MSKPFKTGDIAKCIYVINPKESELKLNSSYTVSTVEFKEDYGQIIRLKELPTGGRFTADQFESVNKDLDIKAIYEQT